MTCRSTNTNLIESVTAEYLPLTELDIKAHIMLALFLVYVTVPSWHSISCTWALLVLQRPFGLCYG